MTSNATISTPEVAFAQLTQPVAGTLKAIVALHWFESGCQILALAFVIGWLEISLPTVTLASIVAGFLLWNLISIQIVRNSASLNLNVQVSMQLVIEISVLTALLYFTGGATNPFVSLYLLPVALASMALPLRLALPIAGLAVISYTVLLFLFVPLGSGTEHMHHAVSGNGPAENDAVGFNLHVIGMWVNFLISTLVCVLALSFLANLARSRAENIAFLREQNAQAHHLSTMGGMAAAATHSLSTPLSTVALVLDQVLMKGAQEDDAQVKLAREQVDVCRDRLSDTLASFRLERVDEASRQPLAQKVESVTRTWKLLHPSMELHIDALSTMEVVTTSAFDYSLVTILDNAAQANEANGSTRIYLRCDQSDSQVILDIEDEGGGPIPELESLIMNAKGSEKPHGAGVGLSIAKTNLQQLGIRLEFLMGSKGCIARLRFGE